jgi:hypothetical protein
MTPDSLGVVDDDAYEITLAQPVFLYGGHATKLWVSSNGIRTLSYQRPKYRSTKLIFSQHVTLNQSNSLYPGYGELLPSGSLSPYSILPFWKDLYLIPGRGQGIWYSVNNNQLGIEWITTRYNNLSKYFHFKLVYDYSTPNIYTYYYYQMDIDPGNDVIGVQKSHSPDGKSPVISAFLLVVLPALVDG